MPKLRGERLQAADVVVRLEAGEARGSDDDRQTEKREPLPPAPGLLPERQ
jgi:hypothetical protein